MLPKEYFKDAELACHCGCGIMPTQNAVDRLYALRFLYGKPMKLNSPARCPDHNEAVRGSQNSDHVKRNGFDCDIPKADELRFIYLAYICGFNAVGFKDNIFIHIGVRAHDAMWGY